MKRVFHHPPEPTTGKHYWRGLGEYSNSPEFRQWLEREFPAGAAELNGDEWSRRDFLKLMGASMALAGVGLTSCRRPELHLVPFTKNVEWTIPHLRSFLREALEAAGAERIHVIAHSLGNRAVIRAIRDLDLALLSPHAARLHQLVLAAPDIDADTFRELAAEFADKPERCTLYANSEDRALAFSETLHGGYARAGGGGEKLVVVPGVDTIDATHHATDFLSHSYYAGASPVISDLFDVIRNEAPPEKRARLKRRERASRVYWCIAP